MKVTISIKKFTIFLLVITICLHTIGFVGRLIEYLLNYEGTSTIVRLFHPAEEANIIVYFSSILLSISSFLMLIIFCAKGLKADADKKYWSILSIIFFYLALDETASIHELISEPLRSVIDARGMFYYPWVLVAIILLLIFIIYFSKFIFIYLPPKIRYLFVIAGIIFISGALGCEILSGYAKSAEITGDHIIEPILITIEEFLENLGIVIFINALLSYIKTIPRLTTISVRYS